MSYNDISDISDNIVYNIPKLVSLGVSPPSKFILIKEKMKPHKSTFDVIYENDDENDDENDIFFQKLRKDIYNHIQNRINISICKQNKTHYMETISEIPENINNHQTKISYV
jgi:hypothetical protein